MPFITVTHPPKYPLTESEKKWLAERKKEEEFVVIRYLSGGRRRGFFRKSKGVSLKPDWKDCAEFEARLNKRLIEGEEIDKPCSHLPKPLACPYPKKLLEPGEDISPHCPFTKKWNTPCEWCSLKELRLLVEEEMEREEMR